MLEVQGICKSFGPTIALDDVSFSAPSGQVLGVVGENGSGKSTLMRILCGESIPDSGTLQLEGRPLKHGDVFLVHQELALCPHMTVAENIFLGNLGGHLYSPKDSQAKAHEVLAELGYPEIDPGAAVGSLPISLRQVVEIARSEAHNSPVVLFDEPTSSLTREDSEKLFTLIKKLRSQGRIILFISHFLEEVRVVSDQIVVLRDGKFVAQTQMDQISDAEIVTHMVGREVNDLFPRSQRVPGEILIELESLCGKFQKPSNASLALRRGEVVGIAGLNGAGRTELLRCVMRLDPIVSGRVKLDQTLPTKVSDLWHHRVGFVSEDRKTEGLALNLSIAENLTMPMRRGFFSRPDATLGRASLWAEKLGVKCRSVAQRIGELSGGNQQKVAIARLLDSNCDVLLLDEPTRGIDVGSKAEIYRLINELAVSGKAVLVVSSYLPELLGICDRIAVMNRGRLSDFVSATQATQESLMELCLQ